MRRMCILAALATVGVAYGTINFWITETPAFSDPADYFNRSEKNFLPNFVGEGPATTVPVDMGACGGGAEKTFFVWGSFVDEAPYTWLWGLHVCVKVDGCMDLVDSAMYRHAKTTGPPPEHWTRWTTPDEIVLGPGCAHVGIGFGYFDEGIVNFDNPYDLVGNGGQDFLLGAFKVRCNGPGLSGHAYLGIGTLGLICDDMVGEDYRPTLTVFDQTCPANPPSQCFWVEAAYCTPEPASLLVLIVGSTLLRRR